MRMKRILFLMVCLLAIAQGAWAQTEVDSESALKDALGGSSPISIKLTADIALTERVAIPEGKTVTLDLNGHTLQRTEEGYHWYYMVIHLLGNATLTVNDGSGTNSGRITGGHAYGGGGIYCEKGSKLTFNGGTIIGNSVRNDPDGGAGWGGGVLVNDGAEATFNGGMVLGNGAPLGGGIYNFGTLTIGNIVISGNTGNDGGAIFNRGTLNITAGSITDNLVNVHGGAGITNYGTINMTGGSITKNRSAKAGGGIWQGGTMNVQGNPVISDNTSNVHGSEDVYVSNPITVTGAFTKGAHIGVYPCTLNFVMTSGYGTHNAGTPIDQYFFSNISYYAITANSSGEAILAVNSASKQRYITDVMVVGAEKDEEAKALCEEYAQDGWTQLPTDLNEGSGGQYVYLLYKTGTDPERAIKDLYLRCGTGFGSDNRPETLTHQGLTYTLAAYDGSSHIKSNKGDLNSGVNGSEDINLYYTREGSSAPLTRLWFDGEEAGCVGRNGTTTACDLNKGAGGDFVFLHISRELSPEDFGGGTGSADDPYIIGTTAHWKELAAKVGLGETYVGRYFFMTGYVDADGMQVGGNFKGTFDGAGRTLTFNAGSEANPRNQECVAPFYSLQGAMIKNLRVEGDIYTSRQYAAGVAAQVSGSESTILDNIVSAVKIHSTVVGDGTHGGLIAVNSARLEINNSRFEGSLLGPQTRCCAGMVGWTTGQVLFYNCIVAPAEISLDLSWSTSEIINAVHSQDAYGNFSRAFARNPVNSTSIFATKYPEPVFTKCYFTQQIGDPILVLGPQGKQLFSDVAVPTGCSVSIVEEPLITVHGKNWYPSGTHIITQGNMPIFGYWKETNGAFVSDPSAQNGWHLIQDVSSPILGLYNDPIRPEPEDDYNIFGTKYIWLSRHDYHLYVSNEWLNENYPSWHFEDNDADANIVLTIDGEDCKATMAIWHFESDYVNGNTAYIMNDLVGNWYGHTHLIGISPRAFGASTALKYVRFIDSDAYLYNQNSKLKLFIDKEAFLDCPNLEQLQIVQYTTEGTNHYEAMTPDQITYIGPNAFTNVSPNFTISVHRSQYQNFMASETFKPWRSKIVVHEFDGVDFTEEGVKYHVFKDAEERDKLQSDEEGKAEMMETLKWWNSEYKNFNAANLLTTNDDKDNVYYCSIVGVDDEDIDDEGGVMRIYNDPGDTYTYKTLQLGRDAIRGNSHVKYIEFWQTAGDAENSYSDLKMVIPNGALAGMSNLKELRLFYYEQDGKDHWTALGPKDIIPGNNIFGVPSPDEAATMTDATMRNMKAGAPEDFKIIVSSDRFSEFLNDPNWQPYIGMMECRDDPNAQGKTAFSEGGVTYDYVTAPGGIIQTTQVVSQDVSWWMLPKLVAEVALMTTGVVYAVKSGGVKSAEAAAQATAAKIVAEGGAPVGSKVISGTTVDIATNVNSWVNIKLSHTLYYSSSIWTATVKVVAKIAEAGGAGIYTYATAAGHQLIGAIIALSGLTIGEVGLQIGENAKNLERLKELGVVKNGKIDITEDELKAMSNKDFLLLATTMSSAFQITSEAVRRYQDELLNTLNEQMSLVTDGWNGPAVKQAGMNALTAGLIAKEAWGGTGSYNAEKFNKGMREQIRANINQATSRAAGFVMVHPQKNIVHHTYVKSFNGDFFGNCVIYVGHDNDGDANTSSRVTTFAKNAFTNRTDLKKVGFHENTGGATSEFSSSFICAIPDYAFKGCTNLTEFSLILSTEENGEYGLGPENFILAGDSIFCDVDTLNFHIIIDEARKDEFLASESWKPYERFFQYREAVPKNGSTLNNYGAWYAYAYEGNSILKESSSQGHTIQHVLVNNPDTDFLKDHNGALKITVDIGTGNNYQTDYVRTGAFRGNQMLQYVNFTDLDYGHNNYSDFDIELKDYCFASCSNLKYLDALYLVTDAVPNIMKPITPAMLKIGKGVFDNTNAKIRMMPKQLKAFEADANWAAYKDRFMTCIVNPGDEYVRNLLEDLRYHDYTAWGTDARNWDKYIDFSRILDKSQGFNWFSGVFKGNDDIRSFGDFKYCESIGLDYIGVSWFEGCDNLGNIELPNTARRIEARAFASCPSLRAITLPTQVAEIQNDVFAGCSNLNTIIVPSGKPATLKGTNQFEKNSGLKIYVPDSVVNLYKQQWAEYKDYIVGISKYPFSKVVTVTAPGQLADKLGLSIVEGKSGGWSATQVRWINGPYSLYDSLTVSGPLNGRDLSVIRYMAGADAWNSDPTDGKLRYLNLWNAQLKKDTRWSYNCDGEDEYTDADNKVGDYLFDCCTALETVILPKSVTYIGENVFDTATGLKRVAVGRNTTEVECDILQDLDDYGGIDELVFLTNQHVTSDYSDPWEAPIQKVYVPRSQMGEYMSDDKLSSRAQSITSLFDDDHILFRTADYGGLFFPTEIREAENVEGIFNGDLELKDFSEFQKFQGVKWLGDKAFSGCSNLKTITLPGSVEYIGKGAFNGCSTLDSLLVDCDSIFTLERDVFESLPSDFRIYVPKSMIAKYQERWSQYKDHIFVDEREYSNADIITVTLDKPNTLHEKLGLEVELSDFYHWLEAVKGDYSHVKKLKVIGPISGTDFELMRYLAGYTLWTKETNYFGQLEYLDLYDAQIVETDNDGSEETDGGVIRQNASMTDNVMHKHALKKAMKLKTLILPRTCKEIEKRAFLQCDNLETVVFGDDMEEIDWTCFDDCSQMRYTYFLCTKKPKITIDSRYWFDNDYSPTCDAMYVRPSLYRDYLDDTDYTTEHRTVKYTNLISKGAFNDDEAFCAFAQHAVSSLNDLVMVRSVDGWFDNHHAIKDLTTLRYTKVGRLKKNDFGKLTQLERLAVSLNTDSIEAGAFQNSQNLRFVDFLAVESSMAEKLKDGGLADLGIDLQKTLAYVPLTYGTTEETNVVTGSADNGLIAHNYRLYDGWDYTVPYAFQTKTVENSRTLPKSDAPYTVCVPYTMEVPYGCKAYTLSDRDGNQLVFKEIEGQMEAMQPYLVKVFTEGLDADNPAAKLNSDIAQEIPSSGGSTFGRQVDGWGYSLRGTFDMIDNQTAHELYAYVLKSDGKWYLVGNDTEAHRKAYIPAYRAYLLLSGGYGTRAATLDMELEDNPTAIEEPEIETVKTVDRDGTE